MPWGLIIKAGVVLALIVGALVYKGHYDRKQQDIGAARVQAEWDKDKAQRMALVSKINQERVDAVARADELDREKQRERTAAFADVRARVPAGAVDAALARRLLDDAVRAANGQAARSASEPAPDPAAPAEPPSCDFGPWVRWGAEVAELYAAAREQVIGWNKFYEELRK